MDNKEIIKKVKEVKTNLGYIWQYAEFDYSDLVGINSKEELNKAREFLEDYIRLLNAIKYYVPRKHPAQKSNIKDNDIKTLYDGVRHPMPFLKS